MRVRSIFVLFLLVLGLIGSHALGNQRDSDDYGKFEGWILDPKSGDPVNEVFWIDLLNCCKFQSEARIYRHRKTDKKGYFSFEVDPGQYCLHIEPDSKNSIYCIEPYQFYNDQFQFPIMIEPGKITEIRKKATFGGALKIRVLDTSGRLINPPVDLPKGAKISVSIENPNYVIGALSQHLINDEMDDGETTVRTLFPSLYKITVHFKRTGYKNLEFENVPVRENEVKEVNCLIDLNDITGIEGKIVDINGNPLKGIKVIMIQQFSVGGNFYDITDENGHFRITGLPEGSYEIMTSSIGGGLRTATVKVEIKKDILLQKNVQID